VQNFRRRANGDYNNLPEGAASVRAESDIRGVVLINTAGVFLISDETAAQQVERGL
jgi:hypothetical protein